MSEEEVYSITEEEFARLWRYFASTKEGQLIAMMSTILQRNARRIDKEKDL